VSQDFSRSNKCPKWIIVLFTAALRACLSNNLKIKNTNSRMIHQTTIITIPMFSQIVEAVKVTPIAMG